MPPPLCSIETLVSTGLEARIIWSIEVIRFEVLVPFREACLSFEGGGGGAPRMPGRYKPARLGGLLGGSRRGLEASLIGTSISESGGCSGSENCTRLLSSFSESLTMQ